MNGYAFSLRCPSCGGLLEHVVASKVNALSACSAVAACPPCKREWSVHVELAPMPRSSRFAA